MKRKESSGLTTAATYAAPTTLRTSVQTEGGICESADVKNPDNTKPGNIAPHQVNDGFGYYSSNEWDDEATNN